MKQGGEPGRKEERRSRSERRGVEIECGDREGPSTVSHSCRNARPRATLFVFLRLPFLRWLCIEGGVEPLCGSGRERRDGRGAGSMLDVRSLAFWLLVRVSCGEVLDSLAVESVNALSFVTFDPGFAKRGRSLTPDLPGIPSALPLASAPLRNGYVSVSFRRSYRGECFDFVLENTTT